MSTCIFCDQPTEEGNHYQSTECIAALKQALQEAREDAERTRKLLESLEQLNKLVWGEQ